MRSFEWQLVKSCQRKKLCAYLRCAVPSLLLGFDRFFSLFENLFWDVRMKLSRENLRACSVYFISRRSLGLLEENLSQEEKGKKKKHSL